MAGNTRERLLAVAQDLFAQRGFEGVSIAAIADQLGISKQALLHHFESKEKLYGEVLHGISAQFEERLRRLDSENSEAAITTLLLDFARDSRRHRPQTALLMRELLDNAPRAERASHWYLADFLNTLMDRVQSLPPWQNAPRAQVAAVVYQLLGAINYFAISADTLRAMLGADAFEAMDAAFDSQLQALIEAALAGPVPADLASDTH